MCYNEQIDEMILHTHVLMLLLDNVSQISYWICVYTFIEKSCYCAVLLPNLNIHMYEDTF